MSQLEGIKARYEAWLLTGKKITATTSNANWALGDWLIAGEKEFDFCKNMAWRGIYDDPDEKTLNFWEDAAAEVGMHKRTLQHYVTCARAYPKKDRTIELSHTHYVAVMAYERRLEYLRACIVPGQRPHTVEWLEAYAKAAEGGAEEPQPVEHYVRFPIPVALLEKLKIIVRYHGGNLQAEMTRICSAALADYAKTESRNIPAGQFEPKQPSETTRRYARRPHDSARMRQASRIGWDSRRARVAA